MEHSILEERYGLSMARIREFAGECEESPGLRKEAAAYFKEQAAFILFLDQVKGELAGEKTGPLPPMEVFKERNKRLYGDILGAAYEKSFANPAYAVNLLGEEAGRLLSFLAAEVRGGIAYVYEGRMEEWVPCLEVLIEIYNLFEAEGNGEFTEETLLAEILDSPVYKE